MPTPSGRLAVQNFLLDAPPVTDGRSRQHRAKSVRSTRANLSA
jgi:hypothetical protein